MSGNEHASPREPALDLVCAWALLAGCNNSNACFHHQKRSSNMLAPVVACKLVLGASSNKK
jgi:hypothetical protein